MSRIRKSILDTLSRQGPLPVREIARAAHCSEMAARYHLAVLAKSNCIAAAKQRPRQTVGRPQLIYGLTENACEELPKHYSGLATELLGEITALVGRKKTRRLLRRIGERAAGHVSAQGGAIVRIHRTIRWLNARGYMADWKKQDGQVRLRVHNCPFRQVVRSHSLVCEIDLAMLSALLDWDPRAMQCHSGDDAVCEFVLAPGRSEPKTV